MSLNLSNLISDKNIKLNLFGDRNQKMKIAEVKDELIEKYGGNTLFHGRSLKESSIKERIDKTLGGHNAW